MRTRVLTAVVLAMTCAAASAVESGPTMTFTLPVGPSKADIKPVEPFGSHGLEVTLTLDSTKFTAQKKIEGQYTIKCVGDAGFIVYSPLLNALGPNAGEVRIFDSSGKLVCELFTLRGISRKGETEKIMVYPGDFLGSHFSLLPLLGAHYNMSEILPSGRYEAQFVLYSYAVIGEERLAKMASDPPAPGALTPQEKEFLTGTQVIAASKLTPFQIVDKH